MGAAIGASLGKLIGENTGQELDNILDLKITSRITPVIVSKLSKNIIPPLIETLSASVPMVCWMCMYWFHYDEICTLNIDIKECNWTKWQIWNYINIDESTCLKFLPGYV